MVDNGGQMRHFSEKRARRHVSQLTQFCRNASHYVKGWEIMLETGHRHGLACQTLYTDTSPYVKTKFHIGMTVTVNTSHSLRISEISVPRHGFVCKNLHT